jgi:hypothetical protein
VSNDSIPSSRVAILHRDGRPLLAPTLVSGSGTTLSTQLPSHGGYVVVVDPVDAATGSVTLALSQVGSADVTGAIVPNGTPVTLTLDTAGQKARLTFEGSGGQRVSLNASTTLSGTGTCRSLVALLNPDGSTLAQNTCPEDSGFLDTQHLPRAGTYTVLVDPGQNTGTVTLTLYNVEDVGTLTEGGPPVTLAITTPGQRGRLTFYGYAQERVSVVLSAVTLGSGRVSVLQPDGRSLAAPQPLSPSGVTLTHRLPTTGTYTIVVDPQGANTGSVSVTLTQVGSQGLPPLLGARRFPDGGPGAPSRGLDRVAAVPAAGSGAAAGTAVGGAAVRGGSRPLILPALAAPDAEGPA